MTVEGQAPGSHDPSSTMTATARFTDVPPRVTRSFAFLDLCGFTTFVDTYGDLAALAELTTLRRILRVAALVHRARVDKWLGDGALLVALDLETMLEAVLAAGREHHGQGRLLLRGGVTAGPAILCDDDYVGAVVNLAARLCDAAAPGTILVQNSEELGPYGSLSSPQPVAVSLLPPGVTLTTEVALAAEATLITRPGDAQGRPGAPGT